MAHIRKVYNQSGAHMITIPVDICKMAGIRFGDFILIEVNSKNYIIIRRLDSALLQRIADHPNAIPIDERTKQTDI